MVHRRDDLPERLQAAGGRADHDDGAIARSVTHRLIHVRLRACDTDGDFAMRPAAIAFIVAWLMIAGETAVCFW